MVAHGVVAELWVHPIKACRGVSVKRARFTRAGLVYDRAWAVVDMDGTRHAKMESISQRKLPKLATIGTTINGDVLEIDAPGIKKHFSSFLSSSSSSSLPFSQMERQAMLQRLQTGIRVIKCVYIDAPTAYNRSSLLKLFIRPQHTLSLSFLFSFTNQLSIPFL